jgi:hypothetical protein
MIFNAVASVVFAILAWSAYSNLEFALNGGQINGWWKTLFSSVKEEARWAFFPTSRAEFIRNRMDSWGTEDGAFISDTGSFSYKEIREGNLYQEAGDMMLPGIPHFLFKNIAIPVVCGILCYFLLSLTGV